MTVLSGNQPAWGHRNAKLEEHERQRYVLQRYQIAERSVLYTGKPLYQQKHVTSYANGQINGY